jgi:cytochrome c
LACTLQHRKTRNEAEIKREDIDINPDGTGLPHGSGKVVSGKAIYASRRASCHGSTGTEGPYDRLVGSINDTTKKNTIGNYWPYATTLFDYIRRAMPYNAPGSLTNNEVYHLTAYLLWANKIIDSTKEVTAQNLSTVVMPAKKLFVNDDRTGGREIK